MNQEANKAFTPRALQVLASAREEAGLLNHNFVGTEHLLLGLITPGPAALDPDMLKKIGPLLSRLGPKALDAHKHLQNLSQDKNLVSRGVAFTVLQKLGLDLESVRAVVKKEAGAKPVQKTVGNILYTPRVEKVLALSVGYAEYLGHAFVGTEHLLLALLREGGGSGARILKESGVDIELTREHILKELAPEANPAAEPLASNAPLFPIPAVEKATHNFTPRAQQVLALARTEAARFNHDFVGVEHLLLGLIRLGQGVAVNVLQKLGLDLETVRTAVKKALGTGPDQKMIGNIPYTPRVKSVLKLAAEEAKNLNHTYVGTEHILLGVLREGNSLAVRIMKDLHVDIEKTRLEILKELNPNFASGAEPQAGG